MIQAPQPIPRHLKAVALRHLQGFPAIAITGPRQSGKTTLAREIGGDRPYGGDSAQPRQNVTVLPWHGLAPLLQEL